MMYRIDPMMLITGVPIRIPEYNIFIHQPTLEEIGKMGGETNFLNCMSVFFLDEGLIKKVIDVDKLSIDLKEEISPYNSLLLVLKIIEEESELQSNPLYILLQRAFKLILPQYNLKYVSEFDELMLLQEKKQPTLINEELFNIIRDVAIQSLLLENFFGKNFMPEEEATEAAKKIKEKMRKCEEKINKINAEKGDTNKSYFARIISIVGSQQGLLNTKQLTVYQLHDTFERMDLYENYKFSVRAAMVGSDVEIVDWYKDIAL